MKPFGKILKKFLPLALTLGTLASIMLPAIPTAAAAVGPIDAAHLAPAPNNTTLLSGFPAFYTDDNGVRVGLFLGPGGFPTAADNLVAPPTPGNAYEANLGFNTAFYWNAGDDGTVTFPNGGSIKIVFGMEAVFSTATGAGAPGFENVFSRIRFTIKPGGDLRDIAMAGTYTFTHPWGTDTLVVTADDIASNRNNTFSDDIGAGADRLFSVAITPPTARQTTFLKSVAAPVGKLGDGVTPGPVTGGKLRNTVTISGPAGTVLVTNFVVAGILAPSLPPVASFTVAPATGTQGTTAFAFTDTSTNSPATWSWNFGDGATSTLQNPTHTYNTAGTQNVTLTVTNAAGTNTTLPRAIVVAPGTAVAPTANFNMSVTSGTSPLTVNFTDASTGIPATWSWTFGDAAGSTPANPNTSNITNPTHIFRIAPTAPITTFTVTLLVNNAVGPASSISKTITVSPEIPAVPVASFTKSAAGGTPGLVVTFTDTSTGVPTTRAWNFGDTASGAANTSALQNPTHTFATAGDFAVSLTVTNALGTATTSQVVSVVAAPGVPVLTGALTTATSATLSWPDILTATGYTLQHATDAAFTTGFGTHAVAVPAVRGGTVSFIDTPIATGPHFYRVSATNAGGTSAFSASVTVQAGAPAPVPTGLNAVAASGTQVNLSWAASAGASGYIIERSTAAAPTIFTAITPNVVGAVTTFSDNTATANSTFFYRVIAVNATGNSAASTPVSVTTPATATAVPANPTALTGAVLVAPVGTGNGQINLIWLDNSTNETSFLIERAANPTFTGTPTVPVATITSPAHVGTGSTSFIDLTVSGAGPFFYRVTAINAIGPSAAPTAPLQITLLAPATAPSTLAATAASSTTINLTWVDTTTDEASFTIQRSTNATFTTPVTLTAPANTTTFADTGLTASIQYWYRIAATNGVGSSAFAPVAPAVVTATTPAATGGGFGGGGVGGGGGGGGGFGGGAQLTGSGLLGTGPAMDGTGKTLAAGTLKTADNKCTVSIANNTLIRNAAGAAVFAISGSKMDTMPTAPAGGQVIVAYEMGPSGVVFSPAMTMSIAYTDAEIPAGMPESSFYIAMWDGTKWVKLNSTVNAATNTVTAPVDHFSSFGLLAQAAPPTVTITTPAANATVPAGNVTVTVNAANVQLVAPGGANVAGQGHLHFYLDVDIPTTQGQPAVTAAGTYQVTPNTSATWNNLAPGTHRLGIQVVNNDHTPMNPPVTAQITITVAAAPTTTPPTTTPPTTTPPTTTPPTTPPRTTTTPAPADTGGTNWLLIGGIVAAAVVLGLVILMMSRGKKAA